MMVELDAVSLYMSVGPKTVHFSLAAPENFRLNEHILLYEPEVVNVIGKFVKEGDLAIDAGANFGFFTLILSQMVGPTGLVVAFEPDERIHKELQSNIAANELDNVLCSDRALWNDCIDKEFWQYPTSGYSSFIKFAPSQLHAVKTISIDTLLAPISQVPSFMKLDCEGAEPWILYGAEQTLRRGVDCVVVELNYGLLDIMGIPKMHIRDWMASLGYSMSLINIRDADSGEFKILPVPRESEIVIECDNPNRAKNINVMFTPDSKGVIHG